MSKAVLQLKFRVRMRDNDFYDWLVEHMKPVLGSKQPGWQAWTVDTYTRQGSGICIFDSGKDLREFMQGQMLYELRENPGIVAISARIYKGIPRRTGLPEQGEPWIIDAAPEEALAYLKPYLRLA